MSARNMIKRGVGRRIGSSLRAQVYGAVAKDSASGMAELSGMVRHLSLAGSGIKDNILAKVLGRSVGACYLHTAVRGGGNSRTLLSQFGFASQSIDGGKRYVRQLPEKHGGVAMEDYCLREEGSCAACGGEEEGHMSWSEFEHVADIYLGGLWNRLEAEVRKYEGESYDFDVHIQDGCLDIRLGDDLSIKVEKHSSDNLLLVDCEHCCVGGAADSRDVAEFSFDAEEEEFVTDGAVTLPAYLEDHFAKHLKVMPDLTPDFVQYHQNHHNHE
eukprot:jgi/Picsp_1/5610/NSC_02969-R1_hypothetical protein CHLNCDRAFT_136932 [Chlorella variabilis]